MRLPVVVGVCVALVLAPASAVAASAPVDVYRSTEGVSFALHALAALSDGLAHFSFTADPPDGDNGPYTANPDITAPPVGLAGRGRALLVGTTIGCGPPAATAVFGTVRAKARVVRATTLSGRTFR